MRGPGGSLGKFYLCGGGAGASAATVLLQCGIPEVGGAAGQWSVVSGQGVS